ncbi:MAG: AraC family transcriptional regulator [Bacteroidetes bacterium]|nr:AraC family transcriptional regulator [Bacteroidota bacterium]MCH8523904.1 helix-turn-helix domain-containing protein [Balneolales bacterium]
MTTLHIKNMVCDRCVATARRILLEEGYTVSEITLGKAVVSQEAHEINMPRIQWQLRDMGFDLIYDRDEQLVVQIKAAILAYIQTLEGGKQSRKLSVFLADALEMGYQTLSRTFSEVADDTIEQYYIRLKIEKVKEWLTYEELTLSEIAWKLDYSSVQHLSSQFKKTTGMTVRDWKAQQDPDRQPLDEV